MVETRSKGKARSCGAAGEKLTEFHKFPELPAELRLLVITAALDEDQEQRPARAVLLDHSTRRISPTEDLANDPSPLLYVNVEFRQAALGTYIRLGVLAMGARVNHNLGSEIDWYDDDGGLRYDLGCAHQVDLEADEQGEPVGCLYINPQKDVFIIGSVPMQIVQTASFEMLVEGLEGPWLVPGQQLTERLPIAVCAKILTMRELMWDPVTSCPHCGHYHSPCADPDYFKHPGNMTPMYDSLIYPNLSSFSVYILGGDGTPETLLKDISSLHSEDFLDQWDAVLYEVFDTTGEPA